MDRQAPGEADVFLTSDRHTLKDPFIRVFSEAFRFPCPRSPWGSLLAGLTASTPATVNFHLYLKRKKKVPGYCSENNPNECISVWEAGRSSRDKGGRRLLLLPLLEGRWPCRQRSQVSLPQFPCMESGLGDMLVARSLRVREKATHEAWPCAKGWSNSPCILQLPHAGWGRCPPRTTRSREPPPRIGGAFPRREAPARRPPWRSIPLGESGFCYSFRISC